MIPTRHPLFPRAACAVLAGSFALSAAITAAPVAPAPPASKQPVVDEYQGVKVTDDYRWLEKPDDPAVKTWVAAQNARTRAYFDGLHDHDAIAGRLKEIIIKLTSYYRAVESRPGRLFAMKFAPPKQQPLLVALKSADDLGSEKVILDPNELEPKGQTTVDWFVPSPDGKLLAVSISQGGSEDGTLFFYDVETGARLPDHIPRVQYPTGGGSVAWRADGKGVYYTRYPSPGERPEGDLHFFQQVYSHTLGAPEKDDAYVIGKDFPRIAEIKLQAAPDGAPGVLAAVNNGDGGETGYFLLATPDGAWQTVADYKDGIKEAAFGKGGSGALPAVDPRRPARENPARALRRRSSGGREERRRHRARKPRFDHRDLRRGPLPSLRQRPDRRTVAPALLGSRRQKQPGHPAATGFGHCRRAHAR